MKFRHPNKGDASFNLTPLIDVVFQLLIFFMLTATFSNIESSVKVNLPIGDFAATGTEATKNIIVTITEDNTVYFNGKIINPIRITESIAAQLKKAPGNIVILEADKNVLHGEVIHIMDLLKKGGADKIAIATQPTEKK